MMIGEKQDLERIRNSLKIVQEEVGPIVERLSKERQERNLREGPEELYKLEYTLRRSVDFAWALERFPVFDLENVLQRMKEQEFIFSEGTLRKEVKLFVPTFAFTRYPHDRVEWIPSRIEMYGFDGIIYFPQSMISENVNRLRDAKLYAEERIHTETPRIPLDVKKHVDKVFYRFETVGVVWDAKWAPGPADDPFIVGRILSTWFLIDQFDLTKMERYISAEYCRKPRTE